MLERTITGVDKDGKAFSGKIKVAVIGLTPTPILSWDKRWLDGKVDVQGVVETATKYVPMARAEGRRPGDRRLPRGLRQQRLLRRPWRTPTTTWPSWPGSMAFDGALPQRVSQRRLRHHRLQRQRRGQGEGHPARRAGGDAQLLGQGHRGDQLQPGGEGRQVERGAGQDPGEPAQGAA
jgi:hypothetical protein